MILIYSTFSLIFPLMGQFLNIWWLDPVGAIIISVYIIVEWVKTFDLYVQTNLLVPNLTLKISRELPRQMRNFSR